MKKLSTIAAAAAALLLLTGCTAGGASGESVPKSPSASASDAESTPSPVPRDNVAIGESCVEIATAAGSTWVDEDTASTVVAVRESDGLLFVTVPAHGEGLTSNGTELYDGAVYCYLDPNTLDVVRDANYAAAGFANLVGEQYDIYLNTPNPPTSLLD